jgi:hypothetical protein
LRLANFSSGSSSVGRLSDFAAVKQKAKFDAQIAAVAAGGRPSAGVQGRLLSGDLARLVGRRGR